MTPDARALLMLARSNDLRRVAARRVVAKEADNRLELVLRPSLGLAVPAS